MNWGNEIFDIYLQTSASNSLSITEEYISTFKPSGYARTFGRALNNQQCGGAHLCCPGTPHYSPPTHPANCPFSKTDFSTRDLIDYVFMMYEVMMYVWKKMFPEGGREVGFSNWTEKNKRSRMVTVTTTELQTPSIEVWPQADVADLVLHVTINGSTTTVTESDIKQLGIYEKTSNVIDTIDKFLFLPLTGVETGNIG